MNWTKPIPMVSLLLLLAALPLGGLALEENTVVALPTALPVAGFSQASPTENIYSVNQLESYYGAEKDLSDYFQYPALSSDEKARATQLLQDYANGARPNRSVLNLMENVSVGVYPLNPEAFEGESMYVLLPCRALTDDELLAIIDAYAACGQEFSPECLSYRNCARGGGIECSRFYVEEERERRNLLENLYKRQGLRPEGNLRPIPSESGIGLILLKEEDYSGLPDFRILPYRSLTDEELLCMIAAQTGEAEPVDVSQLLEYEIQLRKELARIFGAPLSMAQLEDSMMKASDFDLGASDQPVYRCTFSSDLRDGKVLQVMGLLNVDTRHLQKGWWDHYPNVETLINTDILRDPLDARWETMARQTVEGWRKDGTAIQGIWCTGERSLVNNHGTGVEMAVEMADGGYYTLLFAYANDALESALYESSRPALSDPSDMLD